MQNTIQARITRWGALGLAGMISLAVTGCGGFNSPAAGPVALTVPSFHGNAHGGQQPVTGSTIQIYAANTTGGYGSGSYALLGSTVTTDATGAFSTTNYTCPSSDTLVYITATGGNPGLSGTNSNLALMAALGACGNLSASTFVNINELTTVASVYALAPFMSSYSAVGTTATNVTGLTNAFATVNKLINTASGTMPGSTLPTTATEPTAELNTLADILAACVNTTGTGGGSTACSTLFTATTLSGTTPTDTIGAALNIAKAPSQNVSSLIALSSSTAPFQPTIATATDFTVSIKYAPAATFSTPSAAAVDASGNLWVTNSGSNTLAVLNAATSAPTLFTGGGLSGPSGIAFDATGNAWVTDKTSSKLSVFTASGTGLQTPVVGLSAPSAVAIDGQGLIWVTNSTGNNVTSVSSNGTAVQTSTNYSAGGVNAPVAVAINPR